MQFTTIKRSAINVTRSLGGKFTHFKFMPDKMRFLYIMTVNPRSNNIAFCKHLNNSMGPTYKEFSGYTGGITYCLSKFGNIHSQCPLEQWLSIDTYVGLATLSVCLGSHSCNMLSLVNWSQMKWPLWSIQVIQRLHHSCPWRPVISSPRQL